MGLQVETHTARRSGLRAAFFIQISAHIGQAARFFIPCGSFFHAFSKDAELRQKQAARSKQRRLSQAPKKKRHQNSERFSEFGPDHRAEHGRSREAYAGWTVPNRCPDAPE